MSTKIAQQSEDVPTTEEKPQPLTSDELLSFITHKLLAELVRYKWSAPIQASDHPHIMQFVGNMKLDDGRTVKQVLNAGLKKRTESNKRAVYRAWGLLADMIKEKEAFISYSNVLDHYTIEAPIDDKKWDIFGDAATLVEATLEAAELMEMVTPEEIEEIQNGTKAG